MSAPRLHFALAFIVGVIGAMVGALMVGELSGVVIALLVGLGCGYLASRFGDQAWRWFLDRL